MLDLLGDPVSIPQNAPEYGFEDAWQAYPSGIRRVAKKQALKKWAAMGLCAKAGHIIDHIHHMKTEDSWIRGFVPMFMTYINQERWLDWEPPKVVPKEPSAIEKILAHKGAPMPDDVRARIEAFKRDKSLNAGLRQGAK